MSARTGSWASLFVILLALPPWNPAQYSAGPDPSYAITLHWFFSTYFAPYGSISINNFGPWGFLSEPYYFPASYRALITAWAVFAALYWAAASPVFRSPALLAFTVLPFAFEVDGGFYHFVLIAAFLHFTDGPPWARRSAAVALGGILLTKFSYAAAAAAALGAISADDLSRRRTPTTAVLALATAALGWASTGHSFAEAGLYLRNALAIGGGYGGLSLSGPAWQVAAAAISIALLAAAWLWHTRTLPLLRRLLFAGTLAVTLLIVAKGTLSRQDTPHFLIFQSFLACQLLALGALSFRNPFRIAFAVCAVLVLPPAFLAPHLTGVFTSRADLDRAYAAASAQLRADNPLPPLSGTVDLAIYGQAILFAHGVDYRPRPVYQSYMVTTPALNRANADHFLGPRAPDHMVLRWSQFDDWYPSQPDSLSWLAWLRRYDVSANTGRFLVLSRRSEERPLGLCAAEPATGQIGDWIPLPPGDAPLWLQADFVPTLKQPLREFVLRPKVLFLSDGQRKYRVVPGIAAAGFLLSPLVGDNEALAQFLSGSPQPRAFPRFRLEAEPGYYEPAFRYTLSRVACSPTAANGK